jgi:hypothetical protein
MNQREASKGHWTATGTLAEINSGSLQRIADACEIMAANYNQLRIERDDLEKSMNFWSDQCRSAERTASGLRGYITKLKKAQR